MNDPQKLLSMFDGPLLRRATIDAFRKLHPRAQVRNPVMFTVWVGAVFTLVLWLNRLLVSGGEGGDGGESAGFILAVSAWLWFTVLFSNFAEALAEGRGKAQADALRHSRADALA